MTNKIKKIRKKRRRRGQRIPFTSCKTGQVCSARSGWEIKYMMWLDVNPDVVSYVYEPFKIPYISNVKTGKTRNYIPDVLVKYVDHIVLIEIKPSSRVSKLINMKKADAAKRYCLENKIEYSCVTEKELKLLGLL